MKLVYANSREWGVEVDTLEERVGFDWATEERACLASKVPVSACSSSHRCSYSTTQVWKINKELNLGDLKIKNISGAKKISVAIWTPFPLSFLTHLLVHAYRLSSPSVNCRHYNYVYTIKLYYLQLPSRVNLSERLVSNAWAVLLSPLHLCQAVSIFLKKFVERVTYIMMAVNLKSIFGLGITAFTLWRIVSLEQKNREG